jgi:hypothetical protein
VDALVASLDGLRRGVLDVIREQLDGTTGR